MALTIGDLARRSGVSVAAIRYYESLGLLPPSFRRSNGHREFSMENLSNLALVKSLRDAGMSLKEVQNFMSARQSATAPCNELADLATQKATLIRRKILALRQAEERLKAFACACSEACLQTPARNCGQVSLLSS